MQSRRARHSILILLLVVGAGALFWLWWAAADGGKPAAPNASAGRWEDADAVSTKTDMTEPEPQSHLPSPGPKLDFPAAPQAHAGLVRELNLLLADFRRGMSPDEARQRLQSLKALLHDLPPDEAAAALIALLQSGQNAATGLGFAVGGEGVLDEAPTFRVVLLDWLAQTDPGQALAYSRALLPATSQPDEYAIALRNLAWLNPRHELDGEISAAFATMLDRQEWLAAPSAGFLEAFDVAVALGGRDMWTEVGSVLKMEAAPGADASARAATRAAFIALDRMMLREPETLVSLLREQPGWLAWAPEHRASLLTRLDVRSETQRAFLHDYLLGGTHQPGELEYFASLFPNMNAISGNRLVTDWERPRDSQALDEAALAQIRQWSSDPAFVNVQPWLQSMQQRLESFRAK